MDVEDVAGDLERVVTQLDHRLPGVDISVLLHVPAGRLGAYVDQEEQGNGGDERGAC